VPTFTTWYDGDPQEMSFVDRVVPLWTDTKSGITGAAGTPTSASTCTVTGYRDSLLTSVMDTSQSTPLSTTLGYVFDAPASGCFLSASISLVGAWNMSHIGLSVSQSGSKGKR